MPLATASLNELTRSLGLPVPRPYRVQGEALTAAQVFIALATHLDEFAPQTVRSRPMRGSGHARSGCTRGSRVSRRSSLVPAVGLLDARL